MKTTATLAGILLLSSVALVPGAAPVLAGNAPAMKVEPFKAIALGAGSKRAIGYFISEGKVCNLTLVLSDTYSESEPVPQSKPVRIDVAVAAGTSASVETYESQALSFTCAVDAQSLSVRPIDRVAYNAVK